MNFLVFGSLMTAYPIGLHLGVRRGRGGTVGPALLVLSGVGLMAAGAFPVRDAGATFIIPAGYVMGAFMSFVGAGIGLIVMSRRMTGDPRWQSVAGYALVTGVAIVILFFAFFGLAAPPDAPLYPWRGVVQRVTVAVWFSCTIILALRLLRIARAVDPLS